MAHRCQRILVVCRDPGPFRDVAQELRGRGIAVLVVSGPDLALRAIENGLVPDVVLVDFVVEDPGLAEFLRNVRSSHVVPVIALSPEVALIRIGPKADRELHKPFAIGELVAALDELCVHPRSPPGPST